MATYYLNADAGNDTTGTGAIGSPWLTISKAHTSAASGDTIILQDSTASYSWVDQTFGKSLTFLGESDDASGAVLDGGNTRVRWGDDVATPTLLFKYITFKNATDTTSNVGLMTSMYDISFYQCVFDDIDYDSVSSNFGGLFDSTTTLKVVGCTFFNSSFTRGLFTHPGDRDDSANTRTHYFYNNVFYDFQAFGAGAGLGALTVYLYNNIFRRPSGSMNIQQSVGATTTWVYENNCASNCANIPSGSNNITSDPLFVSETTGDFNLKRTSPCIDTGRLV